MMQRRQLTRLALALGATLSLGAAPALAQPAYPSKPLTIVVPFVPGGPVDVMARTLGDALGKSLNVPVVIDNRAGAGGNIGSQYVAKAPADGYTLLMATGSILSINEALYPRLGFEPGKDFAPVSLVGDMPLIVTVNASVPVKNVAELVAQAKAKPDSLLLSSPGNGTTPHLATELLKREAGVTLVHVPYKGGAESATAILSNQVTGGIESPPAVLPHIRAGKMRALAIAGPQRLDSLPDVPTTTEAGLPGLQIVSWFGLVAPAGTPAAVIDKLNRETLAALKTDEVKARFERLSIRPMGSTPAALATLAQQDRVKWGQIVKDSGVRLD